MGPILVPYCSHMEVRRWVPDESLLQNPHRSHMGCPYRTHIIIHLGPIWFLYSLLAGNVVSSLVTVCPSQSYMYVNGFLCLGSKCHLLKSTTNGDPARSRTRDHWAVVRDANHCACLSPFDDNTQPQWLMRLIVLVICTYIYVSNTVPQLT